MDENPRNTKILEKYFLSTTLNSRKLELTHAPAIFLSLSLSICISTSLSPCVRLSVSVSLSVSSRTRKMGSWTPEEDARLLDAYAEVGVYWLGVAKRVGGGRSVKACKQRYRRLVPDSEDKPSDASTPREEGTSLDPHAILNPRRMMRSVASQCDVPVNALIHIDTEAGAITNALGTFNILDDDNEAIFSLFDEAVACVVVQVASSRPDAEEYAEDVVNEYITKKFGEGACCDSPEVCAALEEFIEHQLYQIDKPKPKKKPASSAASTKTSVKRTGNMIQIGRAHV